ncbi:MAG: hypothetical protein Q7R22_010060 [Verrucomicrobiota bacterium JB025]|nr:hypothetical protein [Verrucomicrobiota bacterium JB025]
MKTHQSGSIAFDFPKNWEITEEFVAPSTHMVVIEDRGNALVVLEVRQADGDTGLATHARILSDSTTEKAPAKRGDSKFTKARDAGGYSWIFEDFDVQSLGQSVPHRYFHGSKEMGEKRVFLSLRVAHENYARARSGFKLICDTLRIVEEVDNEGAAKSAAAPELLPER